MSIAESYLQNLGIFRTPFSNFSLSSTVLATSESTSSNRLLAPNSLIFPAYLVTLSRILLRSSFSWPRSLFISSSWLSGRSAGSITKVKPMVLQRYLISFSVWFPLITFHSNMRRSCSMTEFTKRSCFSVIRTRILECASLEGQGPVVLNPENPFVKRQVLSAPF